MQFGVLGQDPVRTSPLEEQPDGGATDESAHYTDGAGAGAAGVGAVRATGVLGVGPEDENCEVVVDAAVDVDAGVGADFGADADADVDAEVDADVEGACHQQFHLGLEARNWQFHHGHCTLAKGSQHFARCSMVVAPWWLDCKFNLNNNQK